MAIGENLAYVNWTVLATLAAGCFAAVVLLRARTGATLGYLGFTAFCAALAGGLALLSDLNLPPPAAGAPFVAAPGAVDTARRLALGALIVGALLYRIVVNRRRSAPLLGALGIGGGILALVLGAYGWASAAPSAVPLAVQLLFLGAALGGVFAAMILGHWYLVTPKLPERPLILLASVLLWVIGFQLLTFVVWASVGSGTGGTPFSALFGSWALFVWLRLIVGLVFPFAVTWAAVQTARTRSMESATGLLYIDVGAIAAGTILAAGLAFGAGILV